MADEHRLSISEAVAMRNMEGFVPNSGVRYVNTPISRPVFYPVSETGLGIGNPTMGWYVQHGMPGSSGGIGENPNFPNQIGTSFVENPNFVDRVGVGIGETPNFSNRVGGNVVDQASEEGVDDMSPVKKVKFLCSFGGKILPRPNDGVLRYVGGQTRIISVKRDISFQELVHKMIDVYGKPVVIKYQLPDEELDALVSVSCPEDLENMMEEYGKLADSSSNGSAKPRVFLFSASELDAPSLVQFSNLLDSGQSYIDAVNGISTGVGGGITRKESVASMASTQNSDSLIGGGEALDSSSSVQGDGGGLLSPCISSPRIGAVASHDTTISPVYVAPNPIMYAEAPPIPMGLPTVVTNPPQTLSSLRPEPVLERPIPPPVIQKQQPLGYDLRHHSGVDSQPAGVYMQAYHYVDPHRQFSTQVGYPNPQGLGIAGSIPQLRENAVCMPHQQFLSASQVTMASITPHAGSITNSVQQFMQPPQIRGDPYPGEYWLRDRFLQFPIEQNCNAYQPQPPLPQTTVSLQTGGCNWGQVPPTQQVVFSDGWVNHEPGILLEKLPRFEDCYMCQKALPHAHSDIVVQDHRDSSMSAVSDLKPVSQSAHLEENFRARPLNRLDVSGSLREDATEYQGSRAEPRVIGHIDHNSTQVGVPGFLQDPIVKHEKESILQTPDNHDHPGMVLSQGVIRKAVDVKPPYGVFLGGSPQSSQVDARTIPVFTDVHPVIITPIQTSKPVALESLTEYLGKQPGHIQKEDSPDSYVSYDHLRPIDSKVEEIRVSAPEIPASKLKKEDIPIRRPQIPGQEMFPSSAFTIPGIVHDGNPIQPIGTLPSSSSEVSYFDTFQPLESNQVTQPAMLGISWTYPHLIMGAQCMTSDEVLHDKPSFSGIDSEYATDRTLPMGEWKDEASGFQSGMVPNNAVIGPSGSSSDNTSSLYDGIVGDNWDRAPSNSLFSNQDPWTLRHDPHFLPPGPNKEPASEEAFMTREEVILDKPLGHLNKDSNSENVRSNKDVAEEYIKQELKAIAEERVLHKPSEHLNKDTNSEHVQAEKEEYIKHELKAVAEGVAAMVLQSSIPDESFMNDLNESSPEVSQSRVGDNYLEAQTRTKVEDVKTKLPEKPNTVLPISEGIGRLQIIKNSDLEVLRELGSGTFGTVYHGKWRGSDVAIKRINDRCFVGKPLEQSRMIDDFWNEASKLADLHHPNVVAFYGVVLDGPGGSVATVTEYMVNGSLRQALQRTLDKRKRLLISMDVAFGMEYLHGKNIVHFDLKSDNLLVNLRDPHRPICKVGDLGLSKIKCHTLISGGVRGTLPWMAPELLNGSSNLVSEKVDVFSFGIVMWELLTGEEPYADLHYGVIIGGIVSNTLRPLVPESCDPEWRSLMERCWSADPSERPSFTEIANQLRSMAASLPPKGQAQQLPRVKK